MLLARFGIHDVSEGQLTDVTGPKTREKGLRMWRRMLYVSDMLAFNDRIGFRYSAHKQQRLSVVAAYMRAREYSVQQRKHFILSIVELVTGERQEPPLSLAARQSVRRHVHSCAQPC